MLTSNMALEVGLAFFATLLRKPQTYFAPRLKHAAK